MDAAAAINRSFVERRKVEATADPDSLSDAELLEIIAEERAACQDRGSINQRRRDQFHAGVITVGPAVSFAQQNQSIIWQVKQETEKTTTVLSKKTNHIN